MTRRTALQALAGLVFAAKHPENVIEEVGTQTEIPCMPDVVSIVMDIMSHRAADELDALIFEVEPKPFEEWYEQEGMTILQGHLDRLRKLDPNHPVIAYFEQP